MYLPDSLSGSTCVAFQIAVLAGGHGWIVLGELDPLWGAKVHQQFIKMWILEGEKKLEGSTSKYS